MGPRSRDLLARRPAPPSDEAFPFGTSRAIDLGLRDGAGHPDHLRRRARAGSSTCRPSSPSASTTTCSAAGADLGVAPRRLLRDRVDAAGEGLPRLRSRAHPGLRPGRGRPALRLQAAAPTSTSSAARRVEAARAEGPRRRLVSFVVDDADAMLWGGELVLRDGVAGRPGHLRGLGGDGRRAASGWPTSGDPSGTTTRLGRAGSYAVDVGGVVSGRGSLRPPYDPDNERVR